jgi:hypothetical protein
MNKFLARCFFCAVPAIFVGFFIGIFEFKVGAFLFGMMFYFGWQVTKEPK